MTKLEDKISLNAAIASLRSQISEAAKRAKNLPKDEIRLTLKAIELELTVVAEDTASTGGEVGWWIFKAKADVSAKDAATQKVKLTFDMGAMDVGADD